MGEEKEEKRKEMTSKLFDFESVKKYPHTRFEMTCFWRYLDLFFEDYGAAVDLNPDFQRCHVWTREQQSKYIEFILRGGQSASVLYFNLDSSRGEHGTLELVDGKQRLEAVKAWMSNEIPAFGYRRNQITKITNIVESFKINIAEMTSRADVLEWYLMINEGGTPHSSEELQRVHALLDAAVLAGDTP